jgi:FMN phosphatase YigB (HAD superfamily)
VIDTRFTGIEPRFFERMFANDIDNVFGIRHMGVYWSLGQRPTVNPRALIFDMDGVVVDSEALHDPQSDKLSVPQAAETARLLEETNPDYVGWCFDCGYIAYGGADVFRLLTKYGSRVRHAHLKDVNAEVLNEARARRWNLATHSKHSFFHHWEDSEKFYVDCRWRGLTVPKICPC